MNSITTLPAVAMYNRVATLECLTGHDLEGGPIEPLFDRLAALAATTFHAPVCMISLLGEQDQVLIGRFGIDIDLVPRALSFCDDAILGGGVAVIPDLSRDMRYVTNPFVQGDPHARFYAGTAMIDANGRCIGTFCIMDTVPRPHFPEEARAMLIQLASAAAGALDTRRTQRPGAAARHFVEATAMAIVTATHCGRITFWNDAAAAMFGYSADEANGRNLTLIIPDRFRDAHQRGLSRLLHGGVATLAGKTVEVQALDRAGREFPIEMMLTYWEGSHGCGVGAHIRDISERRLREAKLQHLAHHDELTGLLNRRGFVEQLERRIAEHGDATLLALDLDAFKDVNDAFGHAVGDAFLQALAIRLASVLQPGAAMVGRIGGDEFAILLDVGTGLAEAADVACTVLGAFCDPLAIAQHLLPVGISIGIAAAPIHASEVQELLVRADLALFRSKREGGRTFRIFDSEMSNDLAATRAVKIELGRATANREWELLYQPQVSLPSGRLVGAEALLRWRHPQRGLLAPDAFLPMLECHAAAFEVGCWVIDRTCAQIAEWRADKLPVDRISLNLFAAQIRAGNLATIVQAALDRHGLRPSDLELEITESIALRRDSELEPLRALHDAGVAIAFDDFGTGFASLTTLKRFPLSRLKIDRSFVTDLATDPHSAAIVEGVIAIGHSLNLCVIAEGIETATQERTLAGLGCDEGQGYRYGRPMPGPDMPIRFSQRAACGGAVLFPV